MERFGPDISGAMPFWFKEAWERLAEEERKRLLADAGAMILRDAAAMMPGHPNCRRLPPDFGVTRSFEIAELEAIWELPEFGGES